MHKNVSTLANHSFYSTTKILNIFEKKIYIFGIGVVSEKKLVPRMTSSPPSPSSASLNEILTSHDDATLKHAPIQILINIAFYF